jgi:DNA-binding response OmpR family regulator
MNVVADDEPQIRQLVKRILSDHGFSIFEAKDGMEAFAVIRELNGEISLLVTDTDMPYLGGTGLCRIVKERFPSVPVLLMSGLTDSDEYNVADVFLHKPSQLCLLSSVVADLCSKSHKLTERQP